MQSQCTKSYFYIDILCRLKMKSKMNPMLAFAKQSFSDSFLFVNLNSTACTHTMSIPPLSPSPCPPCSLACHNRHTHVFMAYEQQCATADVPHHTWYIVLTRVIESMGLRHKSVSLFFSLFLILFFLVWQSPQPPRQQQRLPWPPLALPHHSRAGARDRHISGPW